MLVDIEYDLEDTRVRQPKLDKNCTNLEYRGKSGSTRRYAYCGLKRCFLKSCSTCIRRSV